MPGSQCLCRALVPSSGDLPFPSVAATSMNASLTLHVPIPPTLAKRVHVQRGHRSGLGALTSRSRQSSSTTPRSRSLSLRSSTDGCAEAAPGCTQQHRHANTHTLCACVAARLLCNRRLKKIKLFLCTSTRPTLEPMQQQTSPKVTGMGLPKTLVVSVACCCGKRGRSAQPS